MIRRRILVGVVGLVVIGLAFAGITAWKLSSNIETAVLSDHAEGVDTKPTEPNDAMNILLMGSDTRDLKSKSYGGGDGGARSDSMVLMHISKGDTRIDAVQIPRDTIAELPACDDTGLGAFAGGLDMINSAFEYGPGCSVKAAEQLTGLRISHFVVVDFDGFAHMVNAMDGIQVCLAQPMVDVQAKLDLPAGKQTIKGRDALALARTRHAIGDGSDIGRLGNQQKVMSAIVARATSAGVISRPDRLLSFLDAATKSMTVDEDMSSIKALTSMAKRVSKVPRKNITFLTMPWEQAPQDPNRVVPSQDATRVFEALKADAKVRVSSPEDAAASGSSSSSTTNADLGPISVLNASGHEGWASTTAESLRGEDYVIGSVANASSLRQRSVVTVPRGDKAQWRAGQKVAKALGGLRVESGGVQAITVFVGQDVDKAPTVSVQRSTKKIETTARNAAESLCE